MNSTDLKAAIIGITNAHYPGAYKMPADPHNVRRTDGPFSVHDKTVIVTEAPDHESVDRQDSWIGEFYGSNKTADAVFACRAMNAHEALVEELAKAHKIIANALAVMNSEQLRQWGDRNEANHVDGEGITRANERLAVIEMARGDA